MSRTQLSLVLVLATSVVAAASSPAAAQSPAAPDLPAAADLLDRSYAAMGVPDGETGTVRAHGKASWEAVGGLGFLTEVYAPGHKARAELEFELFGTLVMASDGETVWEEEPLSGVTIRTGWDGSALLREMGVARRTAWRELYERARTVGTDTVEGHDCWVVQAAPRLLLPASEDERARSTPPDVWYLDRESLLPVRVVAKGSGLLDEPTETVMDLSEWREHDGVLDPCHARYTISGLTFDLRWTSVERGVEVPDAFFAPGESVLVAKRAREEAESSGDGDVTIEVLEERHIASIRVEAPHAELQRTFSVLLPEAMMHCTSVGAHLTGPPLARYHNWGDPVDVECGMPVAEAPPEKGRVKARTLPGGKAVVAWHVGPYESLGDTHARILAYIEGHELTVRDAPWEEYWTDPGMERDPQKWRSRVVYPVE